MIARSGDFRSRNFRGTHDKLNFEGCAFLFAIALWNNAQFNFVGFYFRRGEALRKQNSYQNYTRVAYMVAITTMHAPEHFDSHLACLATTYGQ